MRLLASFVAVLLAMAGAPAAAQSWPSGPVKLVVPYGPGSTPDIMARLLAEKMAPRIGQPVVVENKAGAAGHIGTDAVAKAKPDGQTIGLSIAGPLAVNTLLFKRMPYDPARDLQPVTIAATQPSVLVAAPKLNIGSTSELMALLKANPGKYNYGSAGNGTILHLGAEQFKDATGTFSTHIPYRGTGPMVADLIGGQVDWAVVALPAIQGQVKAGLVRALAIASPQRSAAAPDIPTAAEAGVPGFQVEGWFALIGPKGLSAEQVKRVNQAVVTAFGTPEVKEAMAKQGNMIHVSTPEAATAHFKRELVKYAALVKKAGVEAQ